MVKYVDVIGNDAVEVETSIIQLAPSDQHVSFNDNKTELLSHSVFRWIIKVSYILPFVPKEFQAMKSFRKNSMASTQVPQLPTGQCTSIVSEISIK